VDFLFPLFCKAGFLFKSSLVGAALVARLIAQKGISDEK
jgi:hypothetical protein